MKYGNDDNACKEELAKQYMLLFSNPVVHLSFLFVYPGEICFLKTNDLIVGVKKYNDNNDNSP